MVFWSPDPESTSGPDLERHASPAQCDACLVVLLKTVRESRPKSATSAGLVSGRNAEHGESSEYGLPTFFDADFEENERLPRRFEVELSEVVVTDTLPIGEEKLFDKLTVLSIAPLLARGIREVFDDGSVTSLFEGHS